MNKQNCSASLLLFAPLALSSMLIGCGEPTGPKGPSGGDNRFRVVIDSELVDFERVELEMVEGVAEPLILRAIGSADPIKNAVDDEFSFILELGLDRDALLQLTAPAEVVLDGRSTFQGTTSDGARPRPVYTPSNTPSIVQLLHLSKSCFCINEDQGAQEFTGKLLITDIAEDEITASLELQMSGDVPNHNAIQNVTIEIELNLAIPAEPLPGQ